MKSKTWPFLLLIAALLAFSAYLSASRLPFYASPEIIKPFRRSYWNDILAVNFGARRIFADLWFVRLMQYYGTKENIKSNEYSEHEETHSNNPPHGEEGHVHEPHCEHFNYGEGHYPDFYPMAVHIFQLDPYFANAALYASASLAFNLDRPEKAVALLKMALVYTPREWKYLSMLAAIGYSKSKKPEKVAKVFLRFMEDPDCPTMIKQLAAFLNKKAGEIETAYRIYENIRRTSRDRFYVENAEKQMKILGEKIRRSLPEPRENKPEKHENN